MTTFSATSLLGKLSTPEMSTGAAMAAATRRRPVLPVFVEVLEREVADAGVGWHVNSSDIGDVGDAMEGAAEYIDENAEAAGSADGAVWYEILE